MVRVFRLVQTWPTRPPLGFPPTSTRPPRRTLSFGLRPEQHEAVERTADYFAKAKTEQPGHTPHFLWNVKMRFGKTFASYQLAKEMGWTKVLGAAASR